MKITTSWLKDHLDTKFNENQIIDIRYSGIPNEIGGLWGIQLNSNKNNYDHVEFVSMRSASIERLKILRDMIMKY